MGVNVPASDLETYVVHKKPTHLYFHAIAHLNEEPVDEMLTIITKMFKGQQVIMAGPLTKEVTCTHANLKVLYSMNEMLDFLKKN